MATTQVDSRDVGSFKARQQQQSTSDTPPTTPSAMASTAHQIVDEIRSIYTSLTKLSSLAPSDQVNSLLTRLVHLCTTPRSQDLETYILSLDGVSPLCKALRPLCATAEGELEQFWACRIVDTSTSACMPPPQTQTLLTSFPYHNNYLDLSRLECSTLEAFLGTCSPTCRPMPCKIAFVGSGPLPLTSLCVLERYPEAIVHNIDRDAQALRISQALTGRLGMDARMSFACEDVSLEGQSNGLGEGKTDWRSFQVVFLAALVGMDTESKITILEALARKLEPGTLVIVRSARGLRGVLYPVLVLSDEVASIGYDVLVEVHPWTKVVNSVIILRVRRR